MRISHMRSTATTTVTGLVTALLVAFGAPVAAGAVTCPQDFDQAASLWATATNAVLAPIQDPDHTSSGNLDLSNGVSADDLDMLAAGADPMVQYINPLSGSAGCFFFFRLRLQGNPSSDTGLDNNNYEIALGNASNGAVFWAGVEGSSNTTSPWHVWVSTDSVTVAHAYTADLFGRADTQTASADARIITAPGDSGGFWLEWKVAANLVEPSVYTTRFAAIAGTSQAGNFGVWNKDCLDAITPQCASTADAFASLLPPQFTFARLSADTNTGTVSGTADGTYDTGTSISISATPVTGHHFVQWTGTNCSSSANPLSLVLETNTVCVGNFAIDTFTFSRGNTGHGLDSGTVGGTYDYGTSITVSATANAGYHFTGWTGANCASIANPLSFILTANTVCTANFAADPLPPQPPAPVYYPLTVTVVGSGTVTPASASYLAGTAVLLTATPAANWRFSGWSGDCSGTTGTASVSMTAARACTATFARITYPLTVTQVGTGTVTPASGTYNAGDTVTLTASAAEGWKFTGWSGACTGTGSPITVTMDAAKSCTATFVRDVVDPVPAGTYGPTSVQQSHIEWLASPNGTTYEITINGTVVCTTADLTCDVPMMLGPNSQVFAIAIRGSLRATPTRLTYTPKTIKVFVVHFAEERFDLRPADKAKLKAVAMLVKRLGFTEILVKGHTDSQGGSRHAKALSTNRAKVVVAYLAQFIKVRAVTQAFGEKQPVASNATAAGRAANRRAEGWVR